VKTIASMSFIFSEMNILAKAHILAVSKFFKKIFFLINWKEINFKTLLWFWLSSIDEAGSCHKSH